MHKSFAMLHVHVPDRFASQADRVQIPESQFAVSLDVSRDRFSSPTAKFSRALSLKVSTGYASDMFAQDYSFLITSSDCSMTKQLRTSVVVVVVVLVRASTVSSLMFVAHCRSLFGLSVRNRLVLSLHEEVCMMSQRHARRMSLCGAHQHAARVPMAQLIIAHAKSPQNVYASCRESPERRADEIKRHATASRLSWHPGNVFVLG